MGIHDRDYYRPAQPGINIRGPSTVVGWLVAINVALYLANGLFTPGTSAHPDLITRTLALQADTLARPLLWWQLVTWGFCHSPWPNYMHILGNMLGLWFLGRDIESKYGSKEFLRLYMVLIVFSGACWCAYEMIHGLVAGVPVNASATGASGAVAGIVVLYALHFPRRTLLLFFVLPVPAWVAGVLLIVMDSFGALQPGGSNIAHAAHLGGAAFAFAYYRLGWRIAPLTDRWLSFSWLKRRPRLRLHDPDGNRDGVADGADEISDEVDRILAKIHREGEHSLTRKERRTLEAASREYQQRRRR
ncbi:MAG: rhomboid family intramembrane serine protease [Pirellulales bacterium]|nr:rhomboid family intramembrane serine protease [Pirellulales bacterium]